MTTRQAPSYMCQRLNSNPLIFFYPLPLYNSNRSLLLELSAHAFDCDVQKGSFSLVHFRFHSWTYRLTNLYDLVKSSHHSLPLFKGFLLVCSTEGAPWSPWPAIKSKVSRWHCFRDGNTIKAPIHFEKWKPLQKKSWPSCLDKWDYTSTPTHALITRSQHALHLVTESKQRLHHDNYSAVRAVL